MLIVAVVVGLGYFTTRIAIRYDDVPADRGWRRWLPLAATIVVVVAGLAEILTGSRAPDPVIVLWLAALVWVAAFLPLATASGRHAGACGPSARGDLGGDPVRVDAGVFSLRFGRAAAEFDELAQRVVNGEQIPEGTEVGGFEVHSVNQGRLGRSSGCDVELWITGWHDEDHAVHRSLRR